MGTLNVKIISSLEKCFYDNELNDFAEIEKISLLKNEKASFQIVLKEEEKKERLIECKIVGELKDFISVKQIVCLASSKPVYADLYDGNYLRTTPGLYPDLITDLSYNNKIVSSGVNLRSLWFDICLPENISDGEYKTDFIFVSDGEEIAKKSLRILLGKGVLEATERYHTEWLYTDCLANFYNVEVFSERHFEIIENFIKTAVENGINTSLIPVFTPPLDTYIGGERKTTQLVKIKLQNGKYSFDFSLVDKWLEMCKRAKVKYYEIPHFYTQWGANHAPKIIAEVDGKEKKIFGWETDSLGEEYTEFLAQFIKSLVSYLDSKKILSKTMFHISDEPHLNQLEHYNKTATNIKKHLGDCMIIDAVSNVEIYNRGILKTPVVIVSNMHNFIEAGAENAWVYYCCIPPKTFTNRFMSMPSARTRILGVQMYKYNIKGFLHWGYNFYNCRESYNAINPYLDTTGEYFAPSGDPFIVYPKADGTAEESIRLKLMRDAFNDIAALELCEKLCGREFTLSLIDEELDNPLTFDVYPKSNDYIISLREKVNSAITNAMK